MGESEEMFDTVPSHICLFRCSFCLELLPNSGSIGDLKRGTLYLNREDDGSLRWGAFCGDCMDEFVFAEMINRSGVEFKSTYYLATYNNLMEYANSQIEKGVIDVSLKAALMRFAHFVSDRPVV